MSRIFSLIFIFFFSLSSVALAQSLDVYTIKNIPVNVSDKTPALARNLAVRTAHRSAFLTLLERLNLDSSISGQISDDELSDMVRSQYIGDETISGNNYAANFNITFGRDFVEHSLNQKKLNKKDEANVTAAKDAYLLIPVKLSGKKILLWEEANDWRSAIESSLMNNSQDKLILAYNDIENVATINRNNVLNINYEILEPMLSRYKANGAYVVFFSSDNVEHKARVDISYVARLQNKQMKLSFVNVKNIDYEALLSTVARKTISYIANLKIVDEKQYGKSEFLFEARIGSLGDWLTAKNKIENSGLVNQLDIQSISRDKVVMKINYSGPNSDIVQSFAATGVTLEPKGGNYYQVSKIW